MNTRLVNALQTMIDASREEAPTALAMRLDTARQHAEDVLAGATGPFLNKVVRIGTIAPWEGARRVSVYFHIQTRDEYNSYFSITGVIGPRYSGNAAGGCGQIDMEFAHRNPADNDTRFGDHLIRPEDIQFAKGWDANLLYILLDIWKAWHSKEAITVPRAVLAFCADLPDTDKVPAWV